MIPRHLDGIDAAIFDLDGTLVDSLEAHERAWIEVLEANRIPFTPARMNHLGGVPTAETIEILADEAAMDVDVTAIAAAKERRFLELMPGTIDRVEPVVAIARSLHGRLPLAVATGSHGDVARLMLDQSDLLPLFDQVVGSADVARHKPEPDVYLEAAARLGVAPERCLAYDDAVGGIEAARRARMTVVDTRDIWTPANRLFTA
ncbi:MAG: HAD family phosphatase [Pseudomonadota bacterium]